MPWPHAKILDFEYVHLRNVFDVAPRFVVVAPIKGNRNRFVILSDEQAVAIHNDARNQFVGSAFAALVGCVKPADVDQRDARLRLFAAFRQC